MYLLGSTDWRTCQLVFLSSSGVFPRSGSPLTHWRPPSQRPEEPLQVMPLLMPPPPPGSPAPPATETFSHRPSPGSGMSSPRVSFSQNLPGTRCSDSQVNKYRTFHTNTSNTTTTTYITGVSSKMLNIAIFPPHNNNSASSG